MNNNSQLLVYKASAGSGKTFTLAIEYIKLLISKPRAYRNILAVTFTNKATTEMKQRILSQLYGIFVNDKGSKPYLNKLMEELQMPAEEISERAGEALHLMIHDYSRFRVETIDSFFQSVMRNLARELELGANLNVDLDNRSALSEAVDVLIENLSRNSPVLVWLLDYIEEQIENNKQWKVANQLKEFGYKNLFNEEYIERGTALRKTLEDKDCIKNYRKTLKAIEIDVLEEMKGFGTQFFDVIEMNNLTEDDFSNKKKGIAGYFNKLINGDISENIFNKTAQEHLINADKWVNKTYKQRNAIIQLVNNELLPLLKEAEKYRKKNLGILNSCQLSLKYINHIRLLTNIDEEVKQLNYEKNRFLLADTNALLHNIIREGDPSFVFEKIGANINHVMIDEFQDTSKMQWNNFKLLLLEGLAQGANSLIVGDVKQSIYRWRNGDWTILNNLKDKLGPYDIDEKTLNTNRRSATNIVKFNNEIFEAACKKLNENYKELYNTDCEELLNAYKDVVQHTQCEENNGYIKVSFLSKKQECTYEEETLQNLTNEVNSLVKSGVKLNDMAILIRKNKMIPLIADYFHQNTPYRIVSDEAFRMDASRAICMMMNALRYLCNPKHNIAKAELVIDYQVNTLHNSYDINRLLLGNMDEYLPEEFISHYEEWKLMPLYELLEKLYHVFQLSRIENQDAYLFAFFDAVLNYLKDHSSELSAFVDYWDEELSAKTIPSGEIEGIRILSIHKSKGLEYPTVLLPFCDWKLENERTNYIWCTPKQAPFDALNLLPIDYGTAMKDSIYRDDYQNEQLQTWVDSLNLLYVAFTRPKNNLIVWCKAEAKGTVSELLNHSIGQTSCRLHTDEETNEVFESGSLYIEEKNEKEETNRLLIPPCTIPIRMESMESDIEFKQSNRSAAFIDGEDEKENRYIKQGQLMHNVFAYIRTKEDIPSAIIKLKMEGLISTNEQEERIKKLTAWALDNPKVKNWFSGEWKTFNECEIIEYKDGALITKRPDRVMMKDDEMIVVDFKFGKPKKEYNNQVEDYITVLRKMGYKNIRGYLWYIYNNVLEEIN